jgi:multidrug efflux pump subunit AcrA (membrane-fusion protein)
MKTRKKFIAVVLFLSVNLTIWYLAGDKLKAQPPESRRNVGSAKIVVKVMLVKKEDFTLTLDYVGSLKAKDEASVFSKVTGKLVEYTINEGDHVQKGQAVANIDRDETGLKFELAKVDSPIAGIVGRVLLDKGATIEPNKTAVAIVVDMDQMTVRLNIPEQDIPYFKKGLKAILKVDAYPDSEFEGDISRVAEIVDLQTRTLPIEISIPNKDHRLKSGMFARIKIIAAQLKDVLVLPQDAIVQELGEKFVFTVENGMANKKKVAIGKRDNGKLEVLDGIKEGETTIVFGQQGLKDGAQVQISNSKE